MLKEILIEGAQAHGFELVESIVDADFFRRKNLGAERYLILKSLGSLDTIENIQSGLLNSIPKSLSDEPSFNKNCDLVLIHQFKNLADFKKLEDVILTYEEDPYHFKKYFLYFSESEEKALQGKKYNDLVSVILEMDEFESYKKNPLMPSFYSVAARVFIKLPFLEVPRSKKTLQTLSDDVTAVVAEAGLQDTLKHITSYTNTSENAEALVQELIDEELENIQAANTGI
jgi:hypothetical protein